MGLEMQEQQTSQLGAIRWIDSVGRNLQCIYPLVREKIGDVAEARDNASKLLQPARIARLNTLSEELDPADPHAEETLIGVPVTSETGDDLDDASTSHLCVADRSGNMVSLTQSLSLHFARA